MRRRWMARLSRSARPRPASSGRIVDRVAAVAGARGCRSSARHTAESRVAIVGGQQCPRCVPLSTTLGLVVSGVSGVASGLVPGRLVDGSQCDRAERLVVDVGYMLASVSRRTVWVAVIAFALVVFLATLGSTTVARITHDKFAGHFYGVVLPRLFRTAFVMLPLLWGIHSRRKGVIRPTTLFLGAVVVITLR